MKIDFSNIYKHTIALEKFELNWRFTEPENKSFQKIHLEQLKPLSDNAAKYLWDYTLQINLQDEILFKKGFFRTIDKAKILDNNQKEIKKWLYHRGLPFEKNVFLSWQPQHAMIVPWKILIKYFDSFYYPVADDLLVFDENMQWALLFYHEDEIYFGTNKDFKPADTFADVKFIW